MRACVCVFGSKFNGISKRSSICGSPVGVLGNIIGLTSVSVNAVGRARALNSCVPCSIPGVGMWDDYGRQVGQGGFPGSLVHNRVSSTNTKYIHFH